MHTRDNHEYCSIFFVPSYISPENRTKRRNRTLASQKTTNNTPVEGDGSETHCPNCRSADAYRLGDGRYKCKQCKKKFSAGKTRSKLTIETLSSLAEDFWNMETAEQCSQRLGINRKTAQSYYDLLRKEIALCNTKELDNVIHQKTDNPSQPDGDKLPVFWSLLHQGQILIVFPEDRIITLRQDELPQFQGISEIYTNSPLARANRVLDKFYRRTLWADKETDEQHLRDFWRQAKLNLTQYRGGSKTRFPLFITEMAFRFNYRENEGSIRILQQMING